ncbi:MAG TPA: hypothetical protein VMS17_29650 [Gemmataceae bacterium]|nr:hypothetical protein [Gemmataceae bacterium]
MAPSLRSVAWWLGGRLGGSALTRHGDGRAARRRLRAMARLTVERLDDRCLLSTLQVISLPPSVTLPSDSAGGASDSPSVSGNGQYVAFESTAPNLVPGQTGPAGIENIFLLDRLHNSVTLVSHMPNGAVTQSPASAQPSYSPVISPDGSFVTFGSEAPEYAPGLTAGDQAVVRYTIATGQFTLISHANGSATAPAAGPSGQSADSEPDAVSPNGAYILFTSNGTNLVANQGHTTAPNAQTFFLYEYSTATGSTQIVTHAAGQDNVTDQFGVDSAFIGQDGKTVYGAVGAPSVANNGMVAFVDGSTDVISGFTGSAFDVYLYNPTTQSNQLVSFDPTQSSTFGAGGSTFGPVISADGSTVAFVSDDDVVAGMTSSLIDNVFSYSVSSQTNTLVSRAGGSPTTGGDANSGAAGFSVAVSSNGQFIAFASSATNLTAGQGSAAGNVFLYNGQSQSLALLTHVVGSVAAAGGVPDLTPSGIPTGPTGPTGPADPITDAEFLAGPQILSMSADGSLIAYVSNAADLAPSESNGAGLDNIYVYSRSTNSTALASSANGLKATSGNAESSFPVLSGDGSLLAFHSLASNLTTLNDANAVADVFTYSPGSAGATLASRAAFPLPPTPSDSFPTSASADGNLTVFVSNATNLIPNQVTVNNQQNIFLYNKANGATVLVNHVPNPAQMVGSFNTTGDGGVRSGFFLSADPTAPPPDYIKPVISADGSTIAFASFDNNLVSGESIPSNEFSQSTEPGPVIEYIYLYNVATGAVTLVNHAPGNPALIQAPSVIQIVNSIPTTVYYDSFQPAISANGQEVAFAFGDTGDDAVGVALYNRNSDSTTIIDSYADTLSVVDRSPQISDSGQLVAYESGPTGGSVSLYNSIGGALTLIASSGGSAALSHDGSAVAFVSTASNLVSGQASSGGAGLSNVFLYKVSGGAISLVSGVNGTAALTGDGDSDSPAIDGNGGYVAYRSDADNLVAGQTGPTGNIFEFNTQTNTQTLVSRQAASTGAAGGSTNPAIDDDGHLISFLSTANDLVAGQSGVAGVANDFVWLRQTGANLLASGQGGSDTVGGDASAGPPLLTRDSFISAYVPAIDLGQVGADADAGADLAVNNVLVSAALASNTLSDDSGPGTPLTIIVPGLPAGTFLTPTFTFGNVPANNDNADFQLIGNTLRTNFTANFAAKNSYLLSIAVSGTGLADVVDAVTVTVAPPLQTEKNPPLAVTFVLNADNSLTEQTPTTVAGGLLLSPNGTIASISSVAARNGAVVFAVTTAGNSLFEHSPSGWTELSGGDFQQISAATNVYGDAVVFGVLGPSAGPFANSLWEYNPDSNSPWSQLSPGGTILSVSAASTASGETAFAIVTFGDNLWQYQVNGPNASWTQLSTGSFTQVSAGLNLSGQAVVYGIVAGGSLWEHNPAIGTGLNEGWTLLSPAGTILGISAGAADRVVAITAAGNTLWMHSDAGWAELSGGSFAQVSASPTATNDDLFATLTDGDLWEFTDGSAWLWLLQGDVGLASAP